MTCPACGAENRTGARFCDSCGAALPAEQAREVRKVVTVLFCDVSGSTALGERLDPEALRGVMARYFETARGAIERHGGTVEKFIGDAVMAVFGVPTVREDDALRAVRAALELRDAAELDVRIGVNTGEIVTGTGETLVTGDPVNVAARLEQAAGAGEVLIGAETLRLVRDAVEVEPLAPLVAKGKATPLEAYRLVAVTGEEAFTRRFDTPFVGRARERRLLEDAWERACSERVCVLFSILGSAGVGKSRLVQEFSGGLDATVLHGRCLSYGEGITYWPVVEVVLQLLGERPPPNSAISALLGDGNAASDDIAFAVRKLFEEAARERPLVAVFDDLQWAEPTFLELLEHVTDWSRDAPLMIVSLARPELLELRPGWAGGKLNATTVLLEPLSGPETDELIEQHLGRAELDEGLRARIQEAADGNPLFVEQMLAMVDESADEVAVPPTIQALLAARLDRLPKGERAALERGAVEGQVFHRGAVQALAPDEPAVAAQLLGLVRKELVRPTAPTLQDDDAFRFRHLLIRDAAYDSLPKSLRAELHEMFADWIERCGTELVELDEILGYHLEQAARYRAELGETAAATEQQASVRLASAGERAFWRDDFAAAKNLLGRATALLSDDAPQRPHLLMLLGIASYSLGELRAADDLLSEAVEGGDLDAAAGAFFVRATLRAHSSGAAIDKAEEGVRTRLVEVEAAGASDLVLAQGYFALSRIVFWLGRTNESAEAAQRALNHARLAGAASLEARVIAQARTALFFGAAPWGEVEAFAKATLAERDRLGVAAANAAGSLAAAAAYQGRFAEARELFAAHQAELEERGDTLGLLSFASLRGRAELVAGDPAAAEAEYRGGWDGFGALGERGFRSSVGCGLALALVELQRIDEAEAVVDEARALVTDDWLTTAESSVVRARVASARGRHSEGVELARAGVDVADGTEYVVARMQLWFEYARVLAAAGRLDEARAAVDETIRLARVKGSTAYEELAEGLRSSLAGST